MDQAEALITDPVRKEGFALPYTAKMAYLQPSGSGSGNINDYPQWFVTALSIGLRTPRELLTGEGEANRATSMQASSDFEKDIEADRRQLEKYINKIFTLFLTSRGYRSNAVGACDYVPKIKWPKFITEDESLREKMVLEKWQAGLINFNEAREMLKLNEVEDKERGDAYQDEIQNKGLQQNQGFGDLNALMGGAANAESTEPGVDTAQFTAQHRLMRKDKLNPALDGLLGTDGVDYKELAKGNIGKDIVSVSEEKANKIRDALVNGRAEGKAPQEIFEEIKAIGNYEDWQVDRIIKTEGKNLFLQAHMEDAKNKGYTHKMWDATLDNKTSALCEAVHGKQIPIDAEFAVDYTDEAGNPRKWRGARPPAHPNCRSRLIFTKGED
jgi:SPP1 gp7 family putative phage head morphogenesis protein